MKRIQAIIHIIVFILLLQSCTTTRRFGTTVERDENNPCQLNIVIQVAIQGTKDDVTTVRKALEECYNRECFIPCPNDSTKGCMTKITVVVKGYGELKEDELSAFHYVEMIDDDGLPSNAYLGTPNKGASQGTWRRGQDPGVYCHEVLHFCGLEDKYCSRLKDPVTGAPVVEVSCNPPPDPAGGGCCSVFFDGRRCGNPCEGHDHNIMANSSAPLTCSNILDVVKLAGLDNCPPECCGSGMTFSRPKTQLHATPGYLHFGDKDTKFGTIGIDVGGTKYFGGSLGVTINGGYYTNTDKENDYKETNSLLNITAGVSYRIDDPFKTGGKFSINTHALGGISSWTQKTTFGQNSNQSTEVSPHLNVGAALDIRLNKNWSLRLPEISYAPTFFYETVQHNYKIGAGVVFSR